MGTADLRAAFNLVGEPALTCTQALLDYESANGVQWQRLTFHGTRSDGQPFEVRSDRLRPESDLSAAAREVAARVLSQSKEQAEAAPAPGEPAP